MFAKLASPLLRRLAPAGISLALTAAAAEPGFLKLIPIPAPHIVACAEEYPGESFRARHLVDGDPKTEFSSNAKGTETFVEFDFGAPVPLAGFRHQDRNDPATIAESTLEFRDATGSTVASVPVTHPNRRGALTVVAFPHPVLAQRVRWQVTRLGSGHGTVGGAEIAFFAAGQREEAPRGIAAQARTLPVLDGQEGALTQPLRLTLDYPYATPSEAVVRLPHQEPRPVTLQFGQQTLHFTVAASDQERSMPLTVEQAGQPILEQALTLPPARRLTVYILPHSHTDIGYTEIQTEIEDKQVNNLLLGLQYARDTASNPPGARFVWNVEVLWAADLFLRRLGPAERNAFFDAVKAGQVALCGMYLNELTGLCRPEELVRLFQFATELRQQTGAPLDTAMISDVPGYTWGTVTAMAQAGLRYFSVAPNYFDRIGNILVQWENKPFWWIGPNGQDRVLVWIPFWGYAMSHRYHRMSPQLVDDFCAGLEQRGYPYDIAYVRWAGHGDNARPDPSICDFVKEWNATHAWPRFIIASASEAFRAFEQRYGNRLPQMRGDWTPYWEDGAGSSALETALNRASSDRLAQAEALWALQDTQRYPAADFRDAWNHVLLYSEHTWGAWCSISEPARRETREQWSIKQSYATTADRLSRDLLSRALGQSQQAGDETALDVFNTTSWPRTELVTIPKYLTELRHTVADPSGQPLPTQRLRSGEWVFLARDVPPLAALRYPLREGPTPPNLPVPKAARATANTLENDLLRIRVDEQSGGIVELQAAGIEANFADPAGDHALNEYLYLIGDNPADAQPNGPVRIRIGETGPLIASLIIESDAPGCHRLIRELRLTADADFVEIINVVDKKRLEAANYHAQSGKESVNFAFPFRIPDGVVSLEVPYGVLRPDHDQIPSACKNWFTVGRWADVANSDYGVTWVTLDAPLVQVGGLTATLLGSQTNPQVWRQQVGPTQSLYAWTMNNHWGTNYRAYQEGPTVFRFLLRPHPGPTDPAEATRFATAGSQPLLVTGARGPQQPRKPLLQISPNTVVVTGLKPSQDGRAVIARLYNPSPNPQSVSLAWGPRPPTAVHLTDTSEQARGPAPLPLPLSGHSLLALRLEFAPEN